MVEFMLPDSAENIRVDYTCPSAIVRESHPHLPLVSHDMPTSQMLKHDSLNKGQNLQHENGNELSIGRQP